MVKRMLLDMQLEQGKTYRTPPRWGLLIKKIGTNDTSLNSLVIDDKPVGKIRDFLGPLHQVSGNMLPLFDLCHLPYVVPPEIEFYWDGTSGTFCRVKGELIKLAPAEAFPANLLARFNEQITHYWTGDTGTKTLGTDEAWVADRELIVYELTPKTIEKAIFNSLLGFTWSNVTIGEADVGIRPYLDGAPLDVLYEVTEVGGWDILNIRAPPASGTEIQPFTLKEFPIEVLGDHTIQLRARNISGASLTPPTGTAISLTAWVMHEYQRVTG